MKRIGTVVRTAQGSIVVQTDTDSIPSAGADVVDESLSAVGEVVDVMGPVDRPYVVIRPGDHAPHPASLLNQRLYVR